MPMSFDHSDKLVQGVQPLPLEARAPPVEEAARPWLACQPERVLRLRRATGAADVSPRHFALDLWQHDIAKWLPDHVRGDQIRKETYFGGLYQKLVITVRQGASEHDCKG